MLRHITAFVAENRHLCMTTLQDVRFQFEMTEVRWLISIFKNDSIKKATEVVRQEAVSKESHQERSRSNGVRVCVCVWGWTRFSGTLLSWKSQWGWVIGRCCLSHRERETKGQTQMCRLICPTFPGGTLTRTGGCNYHKCTFWENTSARRVQVSES